MPSKASPYVADPMCFGDVPYRDLRGVVGMDRKQVSGAQPSHRKLVTQEFSARTIARMDVALERACRLLPDEMAGYASRKFVAERIVRCARTRTLRLAGMTEAARQAAADLVDATERA